MASKGFLLGFLLNWMICCVKHKSHSKRVAFSQFARHGHNLTGVSPERAPIAGSA